MPKKTRALLKLTGLLILATPCAMVALFFTPAPLAEQTLRLYKRTFDTWDRLLWSGRG